SHLAFCVDPAHSMTTKDTLDYLNNDTTALEMLRANGLYSRDSITFDVHKRFKAEDIVIRTNPSNPARIWRGESIELSAYSKYPYEQLIWYKVVGEYDRANYNDATEHEEFEFNNMDDEKDSLITILLTNESSTIIEYPNDTTDYYVTVSDGVCPSASSDLTKVLVLDAIPTAFTPYDKEGLNDIFMERHHVVIYDRYGQKAFEGNNGWDGTHKGRMADPGVYYYQVLMGDGSLRTGSIEIINLR
ncbi:MAG: gliding motility-associated C-terminal domain-containing protein, partial [Paludibacteraceae bacterium]|nr:gliding motility-associated C-terminal domain-containing protein [Paludibacteraceae bacterium]